MNKRLLSSLLLITMLNVGCSQKMKEYNTYIQTSEFSNITTSEVIDVENTTSEIDILCNTIEETEKYFIDNFYDAENKTFELGMWVNLYGKIIKFKLDGGEVEASHITHKNDYPGFIICMKINVNNDSTTYLRLYSKQSNKLKDGDEIYVKITGIEMGNPNLDLLNVGTFEIVDIDD